MHRNLQIKGNSYSMKRSPIANQQHAEQIIIIARKQQHLELHHVFAAEALKCGKRTILDNIRKQEEQIK